MSVAPASDGAAVDGITAPCGNFLGCPHRRARVVDGCQTLRTKRPIAENLKSSRALPASFPRSGTFIGRKCEALSPALLELLLFGCDFDVGVEVIRLGLDGTLRRPGHELVVGR